MGISWYQKALCVISVDGYWYWYCQGRVSMLDLISSVMSLSVSEWDFRRRWRVPGGCHAAGGEFRCEYRGLESLGLQLHIYI